MEQQQQQLLYSVDNMHYMRASCLRWFVYSFIKADSLEDIGVISFLIGAYHLEMVMIYVYSGCFSRHSKCTRVETLKTHSALISYLLKLITIEVM